MHLDELAHESVAPCTDTMHVKSKNKINVLLMDDDPSFID